MKKTIIIILISGMVLIAVLWGASRQLGWFEEKEPVDTFVYDESIPIDLENKTQIYDLVILDMSGSMLEIRQSVVDGFNALIDGLREANHRFAGTQEHLLSLLVFNTREIRFVYYNKPIDSVSPLTLNDYQPMFGTPLYDAMGGSMSVMMDVVDTIPEHSVMVTIITDGLENSSVYYSKTLISWMIKHLSEQKWSFSFMGTDNAVLQQAINMKIDSVYFFERTNSGIHDALLLDEKSRVSKSRAIDSIRRSNNY